MLESLLFTGDGPVAVSAVTVNVARAADLLRKAAGRGVNRPCGWAPAPITSPRRGRRSSTAQGSTGSVYEPGSRPAAHRPCTRRVRTRWPANTPTSGRDDGPDLGTLASGRQCRVRGPMSQKHPAAHGLATSRTPATCGCPAGGRGAMIEIGDAFSVLTASDGGSADCLGGADVDTARGDRGRWRPGGPGHRLLSGQAGAGLHDPRGGARAGRRLARAVGLAEVVHLSSLRLAPRTPVPGRTRAVPDTRRGRRAISATTSPTSSFRSSWTAACGRFDATMASS